MTFLLKPNYNGLVENLTCNFGKFSVRAVDGESRPEEGLPRGGREVLWRQEPRPHPRRHLA